MLTFIKKNFNKILIYIILQTKEVNTFKDYHTNIYSSY